MYLGCSSNGGSSSVDGDFIRILAGDHDGKKMAFDISSTAEMSGGYVTDTWAHLAVSFDGPGQSIKSCVDGVQVTTFGTIPVRPEPAQDWAQSAANLAFSDGAANPMQHWDLPQCRCRTWCGADIAALVGGSTRRS